MDTLSANLMYILYLTQALRTPFLLPSLVGVIGSASPRTLVQRQTSIGFSSLAKCVIDLRTSWTPLQIKVFFVSNQEFGCCALWNYLRPISGLGWFHGSQSFKLRKTLSKKMINALKFTTPTSIASGGRLLGSPALCISLSLSYNTRYF